MPVETRRWTGTADSARWPFAVTCSQIGCYFTVCCATPEEGEEILIKHEAEGPCPFGGREASKGMPVGKSLREKQWEMLDSVVDAAMAARQRSDSVGEQNELRGEIRGIAKCIYLMDHPYWESPEAVLKEASERLKMRKGEIPKRATPGCEIPHSVEILGAKTRVVKQDPPQTVHPLDKQIAALDDVVLARILKGLKAGMEPDFLADINSVALPIVKRIAAQPDRFARSGG